VNENQERLLKPIKIDIWSDVACPWCYIGKRKLEQALEQFAAEGGSASVEYHSFLLNPDMPTDFEGGQAEYLAGHKGIPLDQVKVMSLRVSQIAAAVGLNYDFENQIMTNTVLAHQLLHVAKAHGLQAPMKERLMAAHFVEGRHVGRIEDLADLAAEVGLARAEVVDALTRGAYLPDVEADFATAQRYGISGVPFFVINDKYGISGAQESETLLDALRQVATE